MSHPILNTYRNSYRVATDQIRRDLNEAERTQLANPGLTDRQRRRNIQHLRRQADSQLNQLRRNYLSGLPGLMRSLIDPLFRLSSSPLEALAWRDALTRVGELEDQDQAMRLWRISRMAGDETMLKALAFHACPDPETDAPPRWPQVIGAWVNHDKRAMDAVSAFGDIWEETHDRHVQFEDSLMFRLPPEQQAEPNTGAADVLPSLPTPPGAA